MLRVIAVDDEKLARRRLVRLLEETGDAEVLAACAGGREAVAAIVAQQPDLVFLDVQMPDLDGFGVLRAVAGQARPDVVFVTAYDHYAVQAFEVHAVDYLLKPYDTARFRDAFARARDRRQRAAAPAEHDRLAELLARYVADARVPAPGAGAGARPALDRLAVKVDGSLHIVRTADVDWFETDGNYVRVHTAGAAHLLRATAAQLEAQLDPREFLRIHRRYIVNVDRVVEVQPWFGGDAIVVLRGGAKLRLSRTYRERFHARVAVRSDDGDAGP